MVVLLWKYCLSDCSSSGLVVVVKVIVCSETAIVMMLQKIASLQNIFYLDSIERNILGVMHLTLPYCDIYDTNSNHVRNTS